MITYVFIFGYCWVFMAALELSLVAARRGCSSLAESSCHCSGFSCCSAPAKLFRDMHLWSRDPTRNSWAGCILSHWTTRRDQKGVFNTKKGNKQERQNLRIKDSPLQRIHLGVSMRHWMWHLCFLIPFCHRSNDAGKDIWEALGQWRHQSFITTNISSKLCPLLAVWFRCHLQDQFVLICKTG